MAYYMVTRCITLASELPMTMTQNVQKAQKTLLRQRGTAGAWDCDAERVVVSQRRDGEDRRGGTLGGNQA